jgi:hypothetical protein
VPQESSARASGPSHRGTRTGEAAAVLAAVAAGAALRLPMALHSGLWRDEALFVAVARLPTVADVLGFLARHESHPPFYYLLERMWSAVAGSGDVASASLTLVFGVGAIPLAWWIARRTFSVAAGVVAAWLVATSPPLVQHSALVRPYALLGALGAATTYALWRAVREDRVRWWAALGVGSAALVYTHNWAWLLVGAHALAGAAAVARRSGIRSRAAGRLVGVYAAVFLAFLPWLHVLVFQAFHAGYPKVGAQLSRYAAHSAEYLLGVPPPIGPALLSLPLALGAAALVARRRAGVALPALLFIGIPAFTLLAAAAAANVVNLLRPRCFTIVAPTLLIGIAGVAAAPLRSRWGRVVRGVSLALFVLSGAYLSSRAARQRKSNAREIAAAVAADARPADLIVLFPEFIATSFNRYFEGANPEIALPHVGRETVVRFDETAARFADPAAARVSLDSVGAARAEGRGVWFVYIAEAFDGRRDTAPDDGPGTMDAFSGVALARGEAVRARLSQLYGGSPARTITARSGAQWLESLSASYFAPPAAAR